MSSITWPTSNTRRPGTCRERSRSTAPGVLATFTRWLLAPKPGYKHLRAIRICFTRQLGPPDSASPLKNMTRRSPEIFQDTDKTGHRQLVGHIMQVVAPNHEGVIWHSGRKSS